jgi:hypothetical protein
MLLDRRPSLMAVTSFQQRRPYDCAVLRYHFYLQPSVAEPPKAIFERADITVEVYQMHTQKVLKLLFLQNNGHSSPY